MSSPYSAESAESTSDLNEPGCESLDNANQTRQPDASLPGIGQESHAQKMSPGLMPDGSQVMALNPDHPQRVRIYDSRGLAPTLQSEQGRGHGVPMVMAFNWQTGVDQIQACTEVCPTLHKGQTPAVMAWDSLNDVATELVPTMGQNTGMASGRAGVIFTSSAGASPAKTSQLPESEPALPGKDQDYSMTQHESQTLFSDQEDGCSLRMFPDSFHPTEAEISESFSRRWPTSGFTTSPGELWTADTSECHNGGDGSSSLPGVLEATVPERFFLSQKAAAGILRRAERRGKKLPPTLDRALRELSGQAVTPGEADPTTLTGMEPSSQDRKNGRSK